MRAPKRRDQVAIVSAQLIVGRRLLLQRAGLAIIDFVRLAPSAASSLLACTAKSGVTERPGASCTSWPSVP
jgi:hypothetical protein